MLPLMKKIPFKELHPNAGALLQRDIPLLDSPLHNSKQGGEFIDDSVLNNHNNVFAEVLQQTGENSEFFW
jgi:hypothetical protein